MLADVMIDLGTVYAKEGKSDEAAKAFKRASDIQHKDMQPQMLALTKSLNGLGLAYMHQGKYERLPSKYCSKLSPSEKTIWKPAAKRFQAESENSLWPALF